jgi:hypothetical protein
VVSGTLRIMPAAAEPAASREDLLMLIAVLREQNVVLAERCAGIEEQNERLTARVAELERRLDRNSKNSNFPPSQDVFGLPKEETAAQVKPAGKRGKRKGAPGAGLAMVEDPDRVQDHRPGACSDCGEALGDALSVGFARRQVSDVPLVTVQVTEHRLHKIRCDCGHVTAAEVPDLLAGSPTSYGPNLRALAVYPAGVPARAGRTHRPADRRPDRRPGLHRLDRLRP